jgi:hypothetical protein
MRVVEPWLAPRDPPASLRSAAPLERGTDFGGLVSRLFLEETSDAPHGLGDAQIVFNQRKTDVLIS